MLKRCLTIVILFGASLVPVAITAGPASATPSFSCTGSETRTWTGTVGDLEWTTPGNWAENSVPGPSDTVCIPSGTSDIYIDTSSVSAASITAEAGVHINVVSGLHLTVQNTSSISDLAVNGAATVSTGGDLNVQNLDSQVSDIVSTGGGSLYTYGTTTLETNGTHTFQLPWVNAGAIDWTDSGMVDASGYDITTTGAGSFNAFGVTGTPQLKANNLVFNTNGSVYASHIDVVANMSIATAWVYFGSSTIDGNVTQTSGRLGTNDGFSGYTPYSLTINGNYNQSGGDVFFTVNGPGIAGTNYDALHINGTYTILGTADMLLERTTGYSGTSGDTFTSITATSVSGRYATVNSSFLGSLSGFPTYNSSSIPITLWVPATTPQPQDPPSKGTGYWLVGSNGKVYPYGNATNSGDTSTSHLNQPIVSITGNPNGNGYWLVASDGGVFSYGGAGFYGSAGSIKLAAPVVNIAPTPGGTGYWLVATDGGVFAYGGAHFYGSAAGISKADVVGIVSTPDGGGYWLVAKDGGVFSYGDAQFYGSMGGHHLNAPVVGISSSGTGRGYLLAAADGGVFAFGDANFHGSAGSLKLARPIVSIRNENDGSGYLLIASDGGVFAFGDDHFFGAPTGMITSPIVQ